MRRPATLASAVALALLASAAGARPDSAPAVRIALLGAVDPAEPSLGIACAAVAGGDGAATAPPAPRIQAARERGITINTSHVEYETDGRRTCLDQEPSDDAFVAAVVGRELRFDGAVLVASASFGVTDEHRALARHAGMLGIPVAGAWLDVDAASDPATADAVEAELRDLLSIAMPPGTAVPVLRGSARSAWEGDAAEEDAVRSLLALLARDIETPPRDIDKPFLMAVEDAVTLPGRGTVATGRIEAGVIHPGDEVEIVGMREIPGHAFVLDGTRSHDDGIVRSFHPRVQVALAGVTAADVPRGSVLAAPGTTRAATLFRAIVRLDEAGRAPDGLTDGEEAGLGFRTTDVTGEIVLPGGRGRVLPGEHAEVEVSLSVPVAMDPGLGFTIREGGRTVGAGQVTEILR